MLLGVSLFSLLVVHTSTKRLARKISRNKLELRPQHALISPINGSGATGKIMKTLLGRNLFAGDNTSWASFLFCAGKPN